MEALGHLQPHRFFQFERKRDDRLCRMAEVRERPGEAEAERQTVAGLESCVFSISKFLLIPLHRPHSIVRAHSLERSGEIRFKDLGVAILLSHVSCRN